MDELEIAREVAKFNFQMSMEDAKREVKLISAELEKLYESLGELEKLLPVDGKIEVEEV